MKRFIALCCAFCMCTLTVKAQQQEFNISAKSALLMEQSTKKILYENNADEQLPIASVTKIMTLLLSMEAIDSGKISMDDMVTVSDRAMSMGGTTMFLESGEQLRVYEMLKGIAVASANDACVAMAEFISGSEEAFVEKMNERASELGMKNTHFVNTNGLDVEGHYSSARDVAIMSRELLTHEDIFEFTTIWTDKMHDGEYDLANTNKLIRFYPGANGLKTGSTSLAKCCLSASAKRDGMQLIAVVLACPTSNDRFSDAKMLLDWGFANYSVKSYVKQGDAVTKTEVKLGKKSEVTLEAKESYSQLYQKGNAEELTSESVIFDDVKAPVKKGDCLGKLVFYSQDNKVVKEVGLVANEDIEKKSFRAYLHELFNMIFS